MARVDLTVAVAAHTETVVAGPTMRSAEIAIHAAEAAGFRVERLIGLDAPSKDCRAFFEQPAFAAWRIVDVQERDLGRARNEIAKIAEGRWIAWLDADDMFSENWLAAGAQLLSEADKTQDKIIVHPEINWVFDNSPDVFVKPLQEDKYFSPHYFYFLNYYDSLCVTPRSIYVDFPYRHTDRVGGFAYEDWPWNMETMAAGWRHVVAKDTAIFKRRRDTSLVILGSVRRTLIWPIEAMGIDRISTLHMPKT